MSNNGSYLDSADDFEHLPWPAVLCLIAFCGFFLFVESAIRLKSK